ncbi:MAG: TonB-dependent receptor [Vicinamibacteraceae bacterium]|nr:TonB-dependent receptor [Vicinamibacteraceae bacterium]
MSGPLRMVGVYLIALSLGLCCADAAWAQATTGEITGRVVDAAGNVVPGVTVAARNAGTGLRRETVSGPTGEYLLTSLPPGRYSVGAELAGFKTAIVEDIELNVGSRLTVPLRLEVGDMSESVTVSSQATLVETTRSDLAGVVTPVEIENLPVLNRTFASLAIVMPEARPVGNFDPTKTRIGNFAMSGGDGRQLDVNVDGGDNKDNVVGSLIQNFAYESIQEFQVLQHRWTAESGRSVGGVVNVISKSGTNQLRGSLFGTYRSDETRAFDFFEKQRRSADPSFDKPAFERQEYGGSIGGPIVRDRFFFFGALERFRERSNNALTQAAFAQLSAIPGAQVVSAIATPYDDTLLTAKVDWRAGADHTMFARFAWQDQSSPNDQIPVPATADLNNGNTNDTTNSSLVLSDTWTMRPNMLNQFSFHFQDFKNEILPNVTGVPFLDFPSVDTGPNANTPQQTTVRKYQLRNDFTWQRGSHALKFGGNYIYTDMGGYFYFGSSGYTVAWFDDPLTIATNSALYPQGFATPGAVRNIQFADGEASHVQTFHQVAFYAQDDWRLGSKLTLNLGIRWDANIGNLPDQTTNRTLEILRQLNEPRAQALAGDMDRLSRSTPSWTEFQPRLGFAYDLFGDARTVVRGGYGIFYDQLFQNLTLFSLTQSGPEIFSTLLNLTNSAVGAGQLADFRFGVDSLPEPPPPDYSVLPTGAFGRINDPDAKEPYVQKVSIGFQHLLAPGWAVSSDYVYTRGDDEPRYLVVNPRIESVCNPAYPGSSPQSSRCPRGSNSRYFDEAFVAAGLPPNRLEQINMFSTTNESRYHGWTTTLKGRMGRSTVSLSYVLASSKSWGGQPTASYSGNGIAIAPEFQFVEGEWGPTRLDERHRFVASAVIELPFDVQLAPIVQYASARPYSLNTGFDVDGDGQATIDRLCVGVDPQAAFAARGNTAALRALNPLGCQQIGVNTQRGGFVVNADGTVEEKSGRYFNVDLRVTKTFAFMNRYRVRVYADLYNLFNTENLYFGSNGRLGLSTATSAGTFMQASSLYGPGFGPPVGRPFTAVFGARFDF